MNRPAFDLYLRNGIDINSEYLEIAVCAQHNNGGLLGNIWWESNLRHLFPVGEVNGVFGVYRPGGSALNSTQVGSLRAAQYISANYNDNPIGTEEFIEKASIQIEKKLNIAYTLIANKSKQSNVMQIKEQIQRKMTKYGAHIRTLEGAEKAIQETDKDLCEIAKNTKLSTAKELPDAFRNIDILITQFVYLSAIKEYIEKGGKSRGSYLVKDKEGQLPIKDLSEEFRFSLDDGELLNKVCEVELNDTDGKYKCICKWRPVRSIPSDDNWFENVWNEYMNNNIIK